MGVHIGKLIKLRVEQLGMNQSEFARRMNRTPQAIQWWYKRETIDTGLLQQISKELHYNFFKFYIDDNDKLFYRALKKGETPTLEEVYFQNEEDSVKKLSASLAECEKENEYLKKINELLNDKLNNS